MDKVILIALALLLTGCANDINALAKDQACLCAKVTTGYGPFGQTLSFCRANSPSCPVTMDAGGNPTIAQSKAVP